MTTQELVALINAQIKENTTGDITAAKLNTLLQEAVSHIAALESAAAQKPLLAGHFVKDSGNPNQGEFVSDNGVDLDTLSAGVYYGTCTYGGAVYSGTLSVLTMQVGNKTIVYQICRCTALGIDYYIERVNYDGIAFTPWYLFKKANTYTSVVGQAMDLFFEDATATPEQLQEAYDAGYAAYGDGNPEESNPFDLDLQYNQHQRWLAGWAAAEAEDDGGDDPDPDDPEEENSPEYDEGYQAGSTDEGANATTNPYDVDEDTVAHNDWNAGYADGWEDNPVNTEVDGHDPDEPEEDPE